MHIYRPRPAAASDQCMVKSTTAIIVSIYMEETDESSACMIQ